LDELLLLIVSGFEIGIRLFLMDAKWGAIIGGCKCVSYLLLALGLLVVESVSFIRNRVQLLTMILFTSFLFAKVGEVFS
jgi:hypothetical protein